METFKYKGGGLFTSKIVATNFPTCFSALDGLKLALNYFARPVQLSVPTCRIQFGTRSLD